MTATASISSGRSGSSGSSSSGSGSGGGSSGGTGGGTSGGTRTGTMINRGRTSIIIIIRGGEGGESEGVVRGEASVSEGSRVSGIIRTREAAREEGARARR